MNKLKTNWAPFPIEYSSCSKFKPRDFEWSSTEGRYTVWIDNQIMKHRGNPDINIGWFCESSEILPELKNFIINNVSVLKSSFKKIFTCDYEIISLDTSFFLFNPPGSNFPWTDPENFRIPEKNKMCSMICSPKSMTTGHKIRLQVANELRDKIDLFGGSHGSTRIGSGIGPNGDWWRSKEEALADYRFSIVFENADYSKYYTEKITDCFALGVIPIYWGTDLVFEDFDSDGIIKWTPDFDPSSLTSDLYDSKIDHIKNNLDKVKNLRFSDDILYNSISRL
jgi:hypothetical protein